jgi:hypothetical protein
MAAPELTRLRRLLGDLRMAATMPRVEIVVSRGRRHEEECLRQFRQRHPRLKIVGRKVMGVALLRLDEFPGDDGYLERLRYARRRVRRAHRLGYTVATFDPNERRAELLAIHSSLPERQGRPMDAPYLDPDASYEIAPHLESIGVLKDGVLVAYSELEYAGDIVGTSRIMGHGDHLNNGVMFLLIAGIVEHVKSTRPDIRYVFYDMFFGAGDGLRAFKTHAGFRPYWVRWRREPGAARVLTTVPDQPRSDR